MEIRLPPRGAPRAKGPYALVAVGVVAAFLVACNSPPSADSLREWTPSDHHSSDDDKLAQGAQQAAQPRSRARSVPAESDGGQAAAASKTASAGGADESATLVDLTWRQQCATCHGATGRGDGQLGPMVRAPDLTREDWQSKVTDGEIAATIRNGKGKMPSFDVPQTVIEGLVARVRATRGQ